MGDPRGVPWLKYPLFLAVLSDLAPPSEPHQLPGSQILGNPEIEAEKEDSDYKSCQITIRQQFQNEVAT